MVTNNEGNEVEYSLVMLKEEIDMLLEKCCEVTKIPKSILDREPTADGELTEMVIKRFERTLKEKNNFFNNSNNMGRNKKLYLVWQSSGSYDTYHNKLCGIFDDEEKAQELKANLDLNVVDSEDCWTIMPEDVFFNWPTKESDEYGDDYFEYLTEYEGYTSEQLQLQNDRWLLMSEEYSEARIQEVNINEEL